MPLRPALFVLLLIPACVSHTQSTRVVTTHGAPIAANTQVYDPYIHNYVTLPDGSTQVTYYEERISTPGILIVLQPICGSNRHVRPLPGPRRTDTVRDRYNQQVQTSTITVNCR